MAVQIDPQAKKKIDTYIAAQKPWAKPLLIELRRLIHRADPNIIEDWKWGPNFNHGGLVVNIGAFSAWVMIVFFQGSILRDQKKLFVEEDAKNLRTRKIKFTDLDQIRKIQLDLIAYIREAVKNNLTGVRAAAPRPRMAKPIPADVKKLLRQRHVAKAYAARPPYQQRDYIEWITAAKQDTTRTTRLQQMLEELADGDRYMGRPYRPAK